MMPTTEQTQALVNAAQAAYHLCQSLLAMREGATDDLIRGAADALEAALKGYPPATPAPPARIPKTREEAAAFFHRYGGVGRTDDELLRKPPTEQQLIAACDRASMNGQTDAAIYAAAAYIRGMRDKEGSTE